MASIKKMEESSHPWAEAFVVRRLCRRGSNFRCEGDLDSYLREHHVTGLCDVDTRAITRMLRGQGTMNGLITTEEHFDLQQKLELLKAYRVQGTVEKVTRPQAQTYGEGIPVALMDFGAKENMVRSLVKRGWPCHRGSGPHHGGGAVKRRLCRHHALQWPRRPGRLRADHRPAAQAL